MKKDLQVRKFNDTERIIHHLMLHSYFISDIGLLHGQMGVDKLHQSTLKALH